MRNKIKNFIITFWFKEDYNTPITGGRTYVSHTFKWQKLFNINRTYQPIFVMISIFLGVFPCLYLLHAGSIVNSPVFILVNILSISFQILIFI